MEEPEKEVSEKGKNCAGGQGSDPRGGGDKGAGDRAKDEGEENAGGAGPRVCHEA